MNSENFYSGKMSTKSVDELKNYIETPEYFQEDAVLAAILELEKRNIEVDGVQKIKEEITALKTIESVEEIEDANYTGSATAVVPELYSTKFILIFGVFTLLGGSILMALNFMQLRNPKAARFVVVASLIYSLTTGLLIQSLSISNPFISLSIGILGIYLLYDLVYKKQFPQDIKNFTPRNIWIPIAICLLISFPLVYLLIATGSFSQ